MVYIIFQGSDGTHRPSGYATVAYSTTDEEEAVVETTEADLTAVFEEAKAGGGTLDGADASIDAAIEDPLAFRDYLILVDGTIEFDDTYTREAPNQ